MRGKGILGVALVTTAIFAGCGPANSLFPLFNNSDKVFDATLLGEWKQLYDPPQDDSKTARWVFRRSAREFSYDLSVTALVPKAEGLGLCSTARLVRLEESLFIDFSACESEDRNLKEISFPAIESHMFGRIRIEKDRVQIDFLKDEWVSKQVKAGKLPIAYVDTPSGPVLSAKTDELRKFALEHAKDDEAFSETFNLVRLK